MINKIESMGMLVNDCSIHCESKTWQIWPAHPNGLQVSRNRWLLVYATRGMRFMDDDRSIVYQLRADAPDGPVIKEGYLSNYHEQWNPIDDGKTYFKQHGHPVLFGVPRGARIAGQAILHENLFVAKWRVVGVYDRGPIDDSQVSEEDRRQWTGINLVSHKINLRYKWGSSVGQDVEWMQFRLNDQENDIEILQPACPMRQHGHENDPNLCAPVDGHKLQKINQTFIQAVPWNADASQWADVCHFDGGKIAAIRYAYDPAIHRYRWVQTGPVAGNFPQGFFEASLVRQGDRWIVAARPRNNGRRGQGAAWFITDDPFRTVGPPTYTTAPHADTPLAVFACADGTIRLFANDSQHDLPERGGRNPLWCWELDVKKIDLVNRRMVFDTFVAQLPIRSQCDPGVDMCKLLPSAGGFHQYLMYRVRTRALMIPYLQAMVESHELSHLGIYYSRITYDQPCHPFWRFD